MKGWRTILSNALLAIAPILELLAMHDAEIRAIIPQEYMAYYTLLVLVANVALRTITTTPVGRKS